MSKYIVYMLCMLPEEDRHYIGITTPERLSKRMMEHRSGKGGRATQDAAKEGRSWSLARTWFTDQVELEPRIAALPDLHTYCPICTHGWRGQLQLPYSKPSPDEPLPDFPGF